jgi:hypothetical protein
MTLPELPYTDYLATMHSPMVNVTKTATPVIDIWPFVHELVRLAVVPARVLEDKLIEAVYRDHWSSYEHILLPTDQTSQVVSLVVEIHSQVAKGYYTLALPAVYGLQALIHTEIPHTEAKSIHEDESGMLLGLRQATSTTAYEGNGSVRIKEIAFKPWETPAAKFNLSFLLTTLILMSTIWSLKHGR